MRDYRLLYQAAGTVPCRFTSRDVPRRSQPYGLSPPAKTRMSPSRHTNTPLRGYTNMQCVESWRGQTPKPFTSKSHSCSFVSGEAPLSCPEASATSRRLKRRGEARRRSFGLSSLLQAIVLALDLQAVRRRFASRGEAVSQMRREFVVARKR